MDIYPKEKVYVVEYYNYYCDENQRRYFYAKSALEAMAMFYVDVEGNSKYGIESAYEYNDDIEIQSKKDLGFDECDTRIVSAMNVLALEHYE